MNKRLLKHKTERMWIEENKKIHILNYFYYRYLTNEYLNWLRIKVLNR